MCVARVNLNVAVILGCAVLMTGPTPAWPQCEIAELSASDGATGNRTPAPVSPSGAAAISGVGRVTAPVTEPALQFDGVDDYVEVPNTGGVFDLVDAWTIEAWAQPYAVTSGIRIHPLVWKIGHNGSNDDTFSLYWDYDLKAFYTGLERASDDADFRVGSSTHVPDRWYHVAGVYDGENIKIYVNGFLENGWDIGPIAPYTGPAPLRIGNILNSNHGLPGILEGIIDDVRIWSVARTQEQIRDGMCGPLAGTEPGLVAYWDFDEPAGTQTVFDLSGNGNHGQLGSTPDVDMDDPARVASVRDDCNGNGVPDGCDVVNDTSQDCNRNGIPDECDIDNGTSPDLDGNGIPDECATAAAADWILRSTWSPSPRASPSMVYDSARGVAVLFGGGGPGGPGYGEYFAETWEWDGCAWVLAHPGGADAPPPRVWFDMAYDSNREVVVLYGGKHGPCRDNSTWEWDGNAWTLRSTSGPGIRALHAMAYDAARAVTVLFGGATGPCGGGSADNDTWTWDGATWTLADPGGPDGPSPRGYHAMAYDSVRGVVVLFGGNDGALLFGDTWEWNGERWTIAHSGGPGAPGPRRYHAMTYDSVRGVVVLFGGNDGVLPFGDTWEWNGDVWMLIEHGDPNGIQAPSPRVAHAMVYDSAPQRKTTVLFGGIDSEHDGETWEYGESLVPAPSLIVETYATVTDPMGLSFDPMGNLYVGRDNFGSGGWYTDPVRIHRIGSGGLPVEEYGATVIADPDSVLYDADGLISGTPGSVLVGGGGIISAILPDDSQTVVTVFGPDAGFGNVGKMEFDSTGRLVFADFATKQVLESTGDSPTPLFQLPTHPGPMAIDATDRIFTSTREDGTIWVHDRDGTLVNPAFATGFGHEVPLAFGPGGPVWGTYLYAFSDGALIRFDEAGCSTVIATGFGDCCGGPTFGPDGALYASHFNGDRIVRIAPSAAQRQIEELFVNSTQSGTVQRIDLGTFESAEIANLNASAEGMGCGSDGKLYVTLSGLAGPRQIVRLDPDGSNLEVVLDFATTPELAASGGPEGPSFGQGGELYFNTRFSQGFPHTGVWRLPAPGAPPEQVFLPFAPPNGNGEATAFLTTGPFAGHLLAVDFPNGRVVRGTPPFDSAQSAVDFITGLTSPNGLAIDSAGDIYVAEDTEVGLIQRFAPDGTPLGTFAATAHRIRKIAFDAADNLYVATHSGTNPVIRIAPDGTQTVVGSMVDGNGVAVCSVPGGPSGIDLTISAGDVALTPTGLNVAADVTVHNTGDVAATAVKVTMFKRNLLGGLVQSTMGIIPVIEVDGAETISLDFSADFEGQGLRVSVQPTPPQVDANMSNNVVDLVFLTTGTAIVRVSAQYDGDPMPDAFGRYIGGVELLNTFTAQVSPVHDGTSVTFELGQPGDAWYATETDADWSDALFSTTFDMGRLTAPTLLTVTAQAGGIPLASEQYTIEAIPLPSWADPELCAYDASELVYELMGYPIGDWTYNFTFDPDIWFVGGERVSLEAGPVVGLRASLSPTSPIVSRHFGLLAAANLLDSIEWVMLPDFGRLIDVTRWGRLYYTDVPTTAVNALIFDVAPSFDPATLELEPGLNASACVAVNLADLIARSPWPIGNKRPKLVAGPYRYPFVYPPPLPPVPASFEISLFFRPAIEVSGSLDLTTAGIDVVSPTYIKLDPTVGVKAALNVVDVVIASLGAYIQGGYTPVFRWDYTMLSGLDFHTWGQIDLVLGLQGSFLLWRGELPILQPDPWYFGDPLPSACGSMAAASPMNATIEIVPGVLPFPTLIADAAGGVWLAYLADPDPADATDDVGLFTSSSADGDNWGAQIPVAQPNDFPEADPSLAVDVDGGLWLAWTETRTTKEQAPSMTVEQMLQTNEIVVARWDGVETSWVTAAVTADSVMDGRPQLAMYDSTEGVVVWVRDESNDLVDRSGDEIAFSSWDGSQWSAPALVTSDVSGDRQVQVANLGSAGYLAVWLKQTDAINQLDTPYFATFNGAAWTSPMAIPGTAEAEISAIALAGLSNGKAVAAWTERGTGDEVTIRHAVFDGKAETWAGIDEVAAGLSAVDGLTLAASAMDEVYIVYHGTNDLDGSDQIMILSRDFVTPESVWVGPTPSTDADPAVEIPWMPAAAVLSSGELKVVYAREAVANSGTGSGGTTTFGGVGAFRVGPAGPNGLPPGLGQTAIDNTANLALNADDLTVVGIPFIGAEVTIQAAIKSVGAGLSAATTAQFHLGDPEDGGTLLGPPVEIPPTAVGEVHVIESVAYVLPPGRSEVFLTVYAFSGETDTSDNRASLVIDAINDDLTPPTVTAVTRSTWRLGADGNGAEIVLTFSEALTPPTPQDVIVNGSGSGLTHLDRVMYSPDSMSISVVVESGLGNEVYELIVPPTVTDERGNPLDGNADGFGGDPFATLFVAGKGDADSNGEIALADYEVFSDCVEGPETEPDPTLPGVTAEECLEVFDFDGDSDVDLKDFGVLMTRFTGELPP